MIGRIISIIITTFVLAAIYGLFCTTMDVFEHRADPVASGRRAAADIYALFGTVSEEAHRNDAASAPSSNATSLARKIAAPYAVTADVAALLGGKLEIAISSVFGKVESKAQSAVPAATSVK